MIIHYPQKEGFMPLFFYHSRRLFWLFTIVLFSATALVFGETKVFILAGQSNMQGFGKVSELGSLTPYTYQNISIYYAFGGNPGRYRSYLKPENYGSGVPITTFGPEIGIAGVLNTRFPNGNLAFIKIAFGATSLQNHWLNSTVYSWFVQEVKKALTNISEPQLCGMIWMQGETDADNESIANVYASNLKTFVTKVRSETGFGIPAPQYLPFVYGKIQNALKSDGTRIWSYGNIVQSQQGLAEGLIR